MNDAVGRTTHAVYSEERNGSGCLAQRSDRVRITSAHPHEKTWARPMTTLPGTSASPVVVLRNLPAPSTSGNAAGLLGKASNRALPALVAALAYFDVDRLARVKCSRLGLPAVKPAAGENHGSSRE